MSVDAQTLRLDCLREAVKFCMCPITNNEGAKDPLEVARGFAAFVLGMEWDAENDEWVEPEEDDSELHPTVRAFNDEGEEL